MATGDHFAPDFRGQRVFRRRGLVPGGAALQKIRLLSVHALLYLGGQRQCDAVLDGIVDVAVGVGSEELKEDAEGVVLLLEVGFDAIKNEGDDAVLGDMLGDVFLDVGPPICFWLMYFECSRASRLIVVARSNARRGASGTDRRR